MPIQPIKPIKLWCWECPICGYTMIMDSIESDSITFRPTCDECDQKSDVFIPKGDDDGRITYPEDLRAGLTKEQIEWMDGVFDRQQENRNSGEEKNMKEKNLDGKTVPCN